MRDLVLRVNYEETIDAPRRRILRAVDTIFDEARRIGTVESRGVPGMFFRLHGLGQDLFIGVLLDSAPRQRDDFHARRRWAAFLLTVAAPHTDDGPLIQQDDIGPSLSLVEHVARVWCISNLEEEELAADFLLQMGSVADNTMARRPWLALVATGGTRQWGRVGANTRLTQHDSLVAVRQGGSWAGAQAKDNTFRDGRNYFEVTVVKPGSSCDIMVGLSPPDVDVDGAGYNNSKGVQW